MPKLVTVKRLEGEHEKAREYVRTHILFPSSLLGLVCMVAGAGALIYQFVVDTYSFHAFLAVTLLLLLGGVLGWGQTRYHKYLVREHPEHFAGRMKMYSRSTLKRSKRDLISPTVEHKWRNLVPLFYTLGIATLLGAAMVSWLGGQLDGVVALFMPWAGFYWAKTFFWRGVIVPPTRGGKK